MDRLKIYLIVSFCIIAGFSMLPSPRRAVAPVQRGSHYPFLMPNIQVGITEYTTQLLDLNTGYVYDGTAQVPTRMMDAPAGVTLVQGGAHDWACVAAGNVWMKGINQAGECGNGNQSPISTYTEITTDSAGNPFTGITYTIGGETTYGFYWNQWFIKSDSTLWADGDLEGGQRGNGTAGGVYTRPVQIPFPVGTKIVQVSPGNIVIARDAAGKVWAWGGGNSYFDPFLGRGTSPNYYTPSVITFDVADSAIDIAGGTSWSYALLKHGTTTELRGWGNQTSYMALGNAGWQSQLAARNTPWNIDTAISAYMPSGYVIRHIYVTGSATYALCDGGNLFGWGGNESGAMGIGTEINYYLYGGYPLPYGTTNPFPFQWQQGFGNFMQQKPVWIGQGIHFKIVYATNTLVYCMICQDSSLNLYACGRNKSGEIPNGIIDANPTNGNLASQYPNSWDVPGLTRIAPLSNTAQIQVSSPWCAAHPAATYCNIYTIPTAAAPTIYAGGNKTVYTSSTTLAGTCTPAAAYYMFYQDWTQISGPNTALMTLPTDVQPTVSNLIPGTYVFQLYGVDQNLRTGTSNMTLTVAPPQVTDKLQIKKRKGHPIHYSIHYH